MHPEPGSRIGPYRYLPAAFARDGHTKAPDFGLAAHAARSSPPNSWFRRNALLACLREESRFRWILGTLDRGRVDRGGSGAP